MKQVNYLLYILMTGLLSCGLGDSIDKAAERITDELDESIEKLEVESGDWKTVLEDLEKNLSDDVSEKIRGEVSNVLNTTIAVTGAEFRCNTDFLRKRVVQSLRGIRAHVKEILNGVAYKPEVVPYICNTVPESVDMDLPVASRREVKYYGFDMIETEVKAFGIINRNGSNQEFDLSQYLAFGTPYKMSLDLSRVTLEDSWHQIVIKKNDIRLSTIPVLAKPPVNCDEQRHTQEMNEFTFIPRHTRGDRDFGGNGPKVNCKVEYIVHADRIDMKVFMRAQETKSDWTTAEETVTKTVVSAGPDRKIVRIEGQPSSERRYTDNDHGNDKFDETGQQPIRRFDFRGDTDGDEAGSKTRVVLEFNRLVYYTKAKSCN